MADVSPNSGLAGLISKYGTDSAKAKNGVGADPDKAEESKGLDNQDVFMKLYIEQLKNQDPTKPQEAGDMVSQMAEFSSLERLTNMADHLSGMTEALVSNQAITASTLVGSYVYVDQDSAPVEEGNATLLKASFTADSVENELTVYDEAGKKVTSFKLTEEEFQWDGKDSQGNSVPDGTYSFKATSKNADGEVTQLAVKTPARINGVTINGDQGTTLNIANYGKLALTDELEIVG